VAHYYLSVQFYSGPFGDWYLNGPTWLAQAIGYVLSFPTIGLAQAGVPFRMGMNALWALNSALWTVSVAAMVLGAQRLLTWWIAARRRKMHTPNP